MSNVIIGNHLGTWGIEHEAATPEAIAQAKRDNHSGTLLIVSQEEAQKVLGQYVYDNDDLDIVGVWPSKYQRA